MPALPNFFSSFNAAQPPELQLTRTFVGAINLTIPITLTITTIGRLAHGALMYLRSGISIQVVGTVTGNELLINEFDRNGKITGVHSGELSGVGYVGKWCSPSLPGRPLPFSLTMTALRDEPMMKLTDLTGMYQYGYGARNRFAQLHVQHVDDKTLAIALLAATDEPGQTQISLSRRLIKLKRNEATFPENNPVMSPLKLAFFNGGATVYSADLTTTTTALPRAAGQTTAMLLGHYIRTSTQPPRFSVDELRRVL